MVTIPVRRLSTMLGAAVLVAAALVGPAAPARAAVACAVTYTANSWSTGFSATVRLTNLGDEWAGYTVQFTFTGGQQVTNLWNHSYSQSGAEVTARSASWSPPVRTGESVWLGFQGSHAGANPAPTNWRVNGVACAVTGEPPEVVAEPTAVSVPEGTSRSFTVRLSHPPAGQVTLQMGVRGTGIWAGPPMLLVFTPTNWSTPQGYGVMNAQDDDDVDDVAVFTLSVPGYTPDTVTFTQLDDDRVR
ncbi:cellulose binding domain-containing protein [Plantactinospora sonchi]|uniref:Cellulose binding domain-containing protein n=1 Tax=Plantactinospora sonchi TaxID=1544735 RepID=A0ABU7RL25_9ACTN